MHAKVCALPSEPPRRCLGFFRELQAGQGSKLSSFDPHTPTVFIVRCHITVVIATVSQHTVQPLYDLEDTVRTWSPILHPQLTPHPLDTKSPLPRPHLTSLHPLPMPMKVTPRGPRVRGFTQHLYTSDGFRPLVVILLSRTRVCPASFPFG